MLKVRIVIVHTENNEGIKKCSKKIAQKIITAYIRFAKKTTTKKCGKSIVLGVYVCSVFR